MMVVDQWSRVIDALVSARGSWRVGSRRLAIASRLGAASEAACPAPMEITAHAEIARQTLSR